jgi:uncharacterized protein with NAD-binding domain and iron-sulfur cluster
LQARQNAIVRANAQQFLDRDIGALWPKAVRPEGGFRWELLVDTEANLEAGAAADTTGAVATSNAIDTQYIRANVNPTDRYVLSLPGTSQYRLSPLDRSFDNLTIAGDWTATGLDTGCIESAVISGKLAAHALSQRPRLADIIGYDHP